MTQPTNPGTNLAARPALQNSPAAGLMSRPGFMGGMFAGLLGAGLIGLLLGGGLTGGLGGLASFLGLALQIGIIVLIGWLLFSWWQRRNQPATAMGPSMRDMPDQRPSPYQSRRDRWRPWRWPWRNTWQLRRRQCAAVQSG